MSPDPGTTVASFFAPPVFDDPAESDAAWVVHWTVIGMLAVDLAAAFGVLFSSTRGIGHWLTLWSLGAVALMVPLVLNRAGRTLLAGILVTAAVWIGFTAAAWTAGGLEAPSIAGQLLVVSTAGALLGRRWAMGATLLGAVTIMLIAVAQTAGLVPPSLAYNTPVTSGLALAIYVVTLGVQWVLVQATLERSRARTDAQLAERRIAEDRVRTLNADLELRVASRTSELEAAIRDFEATNARLDEAMRTKDAFLASMSHELRTPLNSIIGFSGVLAQGLSGELEPEQQRQVTMIRVAGRRLLDLVDKVLDLSQIADGALSIDVTRFDARDAVSSAVALMEPVARGKGLTLSSELPDAVLSVSSDETRVEQILLNLIGNAIKFTGSGGVTVRVVDLGREVRFEVSDTGIGIEKVDLARVFERFYQVDPLAGGKHEGSGLGLSVAQELASALGGRIRVRSAPGGGSTFTLHLPLDPADRSSR